MSRINVSEKVKSVLEPKKGVISARLFVSRDDGITVYDSVQDNTTASVSALVCGVWQASEALMGMVKSNQDVLDFRLGFDTSSEGIYLFPFNISGKRYFLGAIYKDCVNPGFLKRQISQIKQEFEKLFVNEPVAIKKVVQPVRDGFLFKEITDEEIDRLFSVSGI